MPKLSPWVSSGWKCIIIVTTVITMLLAWSTVMTERGMLAFPYRCRRRNVFLSPTPQEDTHRANIRTCWVNWSPQSNIRTCWLNWACAIKKLTIYLRIFKVALVGGFMILKHTFQAGFSKQKFCHMVFYFHFYLHVLMSVETSAFSTSFSKVPL